MTLSPTPAEELPTLDDLAVDAQNILEMIHMAEDDMAYISWNVPLEKSMVNRHGTVLTVTRKLIEELTRHVEGLALAPQMQAAEKAIRAEN